MGEIGFEWIKFLSLIGGTYMNKRIFISILIFLTSFVYIHLLKAWGGYEAEMLDLLKQKGILTEEEWQNIKAQMEKDTAKQLQTEYKDGFKLFTRDKQFEIAVEGRVYGDMRFWLNDESSHSNTFLVRTARLTAAGSLYKYYKFKVEADFGDGQAQLKDGYIEAAYIKPLNIRFGQFKEPFSLEENTSSRYIDFVERSMLNGLVPARDVGCMIHGSLYNDQIIYGIGGFNGNGVNTTDNSDDKDLAFRLVLSPFLGQEGNLFQNFHFGGAFTYGYQDKFVSDFKLRSESRSTILQIAKDTPYDSRMRWGTELAYTYGPFSLKAEYVRTEFGDVKNTKTGVVEDYDINAYYITLGYFLTGEEKAWKQGNFSRTKPRKNFDPFKGTWGAWEVLFRYSRLDADKDLFKNGICSASKYTDEATSYSFGINWYLNPMVVMKLNYIHSKYDDHLPGKNGKTYDSENFITTRFQIEF